jgi:hypothetical protein
MSAPPGGIITLAETPAPGLQAESPLSRHLAKLLSQDHTCLLPLQRLPQGLDFLGLSCPNRAFSRAYADPQALFFLLLPCPPSRLNPLVVGRTSR